MVWFGYTLCKYMNYFIYIIQHVSNLLAILRFTTRYYKKTLINIIIETCNSNKNILSVLMVSLKMTNRLGTFSCL